METRDFDIHEITSIPLVTSDGAMLITSSEVIIIMHQRARYGKNKTVHSSTQIEYYKNKVDNRSIKVCGGQCTTTLDNHKVPMSIRNALPYMTLRPYTEN